MRDVLALDNPPKEMDTWKRKCEVVELRCTTFQEEFDALHEKVKHANSLKENAKTQVPPSTLVARVNELEVALKEADKRYQDSFDVVIEKTYQAEEDRKTLILKVEAHPKALKTLEIMSPV